MSRGVWEARRFTAAWSRAFTVWVDDSWDEPAAPGGYIILWIDEASNLRRSFGVASQVEARGLDLAGSYFAFDASPPPIVTRSQIHLVVLVGNPGGVTIGTRSLDTEIPPRNVP